MRKPEHAVDGQFVDRWSPRAMSGGMVSEAELLSLFEAARWAPSCFNAQPWRILYACRGSAYWETFFDLLVPANKVWAERASALLVFVGRKLFEHNGKPNPSYAYDTGAAWENLALQGSLKGLVVHGMAGFDYEKARTALRVPDEFAVMAMAAVGQPGGEELLSEELRKRDVPSGRKPLGEIALEGGFQ